MRLLFTHIWIVVGSAGALLVGWLAFLRWFRKKPKRIIMPMRLLEEMSRFAEELRFVEDSIDAVAHELSEPGRRRWRRTSRKMLKRLRSVNRLLARLNMLFEEEQVRLMVRQRRERTTPKETPVPPHEPHPQKNGITEQEIHNIDWDDFRRRLLDD